MKNFNLEAILFFLFGILSIGFIISGVVILITSIFVYFSPLILLGSAIMILFGITAFAVVKLFFTLQELIGTLFKGFESLSVAFKNMAISPPTDNLEKFNKFKNSLFSKQSSPEVINIKITEETTPEEIEEIKKNFPPLANQIDDFLKHIVDETKGTLNHPFSHLFSGKKKDIKEMTIEELKEELGESIKDEKFEKSIQIKEELKNRAEKS